MFPPQGVPSPGDSVCVTDQLSSPSDFLLHRALASHLKDAKENKCLVLSVSESIGRWKAVSSKSNVNLAQHVSTGSLAFVDVTAPTQHDLPNVSDSSLKAAFDVARFHVNEWLQQDLCSILVIIDDISTLQWIGYPTFELLRFVRAMCALCRKANAAILIRHHLLTPDEPDEIFHLLLQLCTYHFEVLPLSSGKSGSVSGQVAFHFGAGVTGSPSKAVARSSAIQYRLTDTNCMFFDRGTGSTVL